MGLRPVSSDFEEIATNTPVREDALVANLLFRAQLPPITLTVTAGVKNAFTWVSGHIINKPEPEHRGPRWQVPGMIVGKCLGREETRNARLFTGKSGQRLLNFMQDAGADDLGQYYCTNLLKTTPLIVGGWQQKWVDQQQFLLDMEIALVRPKFVLSLGKEATKYFIKRAGAISQIEGNWFDCELDLRQNKDEEKTEENFHRYRVMPCTHPASLDYEERQGVVERIQQVVHQFVSAVKSGTVKKNKEIQYEYVTNAVDLQKVFDRIRKEHTLHMIAVDAEWQGEHPQNKGSYLRCIQMAWGKGLAAVVQLTDTEGRPAFTGPDGKCNKASMKYALKEIEDFFASGFRVGGHFFPADLEWITYFGCDLAPYYEAAATVKEAKTKGGFALEAAVHAYDELADMSLDSVCARFTDMPPYKHKLFEHKKKMKEEAAKGSHNRKDKELAARCKAMVAKIDAGFGWIENDVLYPYAAGDVDATWRAIMRFIELLDADRFGNNCWVPYWRNHRASLVAAEIMQLGLLVNKRRLARYCKAYKAIYEDLSAELQKIARWPGFNCDNYRHVLEFVYGQRYSAAKDKVTGFRKSVRPPGALTLNAEPILTNEKSPRIWEDVRRRGEENISTPGTNGKTIGVLHNNPAGLKVRRYNPITDRWEIRDITSPQSLMMIRDLRTIRQVQKTFVGKDVKMRRGPDGEPIYEFDGGLGPTICDDGYVRCFISQVKETGRWAAKSPNLHALPKRKEDRYQKIAGDRYPGPIRSIFEATPGYFLVESDYSSAELFMLSIASGDQQLWDDCQRSLLDESHPEYLDPHSKMAVDALQLNCKPSKSGLASIGKKYMRDVAKCVAEGELLNCSLGLVPVERFAEGLQAGESRQIDSDIGCQSDWGETPLLAIENTGEKECVRVRTSLGYELICTPDHRCYVLRANGDIEFVAPKDFKPGDHFLISPYLSNKNEKACVIGSILKMLDLFAKTERTDKQITEDEAEVLGIVAAIHAYGAYQVDGNRCLLTIGSPRDKRLNQYVADRLSKLGDVDTKPCSMIGTHHIATAGIGMNGLMKATAEKGWIGIPDLVLMWPEKHRTRFLQGYVSVVATGSIESPAVVVRNEEEGRLLQQMLLASGILSHRASHEHANVIVPADATSRSWFKMTVGSLDSFVNTTVSDTRLPYLDMRLKSMIKEIGLPSPTENPKVYTKRRQILERLNAIGKIEGLLEKPDKRYIRRVRDLIQSQLVADKIETVTSVGKRKTYDVQTTENRRHLVLFGGICTHNSVVYGWCYGRQPPAIVLGAAEEGVIIQLSDAEAIFNELERKYNKAQGYLRAAADRVQVGCLCTPLGRWRRFPESTDKKTLSGYQREAMNSPIQGGVADLVNDAAFNLRQIRREKSLGFRIALQVHDAFLFLVPYSELIEVCNYVIPEAMVQRGGVVPYRLDGTKTQREPKRLGCGINVYKRWGESLSLEQIASFGVDSSKIERLE